LGMFKQFVDFARQVFNLTSKSQQHETDIKALQEENRDTREKLLKLREEFAALTRLVEQLLTNLEHAREVAEIERKNMLLELENRQLRASRSLPPPESPDT